jgi:hypothetical protein
LWLPLSPTLPHKGGESRKNAAPLHRFQFQAADLTDVDSRPLFAQNEER